MRKSDKNKDVKLPGVGIIIPSHNHGHRVLSAIKSVLSQDYPAKVICVVDDGSEDQTLEKIEKFIKENGVLFDQSPPNMLGGTISNTPIYVYRNQFGTGPSAARNKGIEILSEAVSLFSMLDADDLYLQGKLSKSVVKLLEDPSNIGIVYTDAIIHHESNGLKIHEMREPYDRIRLERECIISNTPLINKSAIEYSGGYDEEMRTCEDWDLYLRITERFVAIHIAEPLHIYTVTGENTTESINQEVWNKNWKRVQEKLYQRKNSNGM